MKASIPLLLVGALALITPAVAQTYTIGASSCPSPYYASAIDCQNVPLTIGTTTTTEWLFADYPPYTAEQFFWGALGDFDVTNIQIVSYTTVTWTSLGKPYSANLPAEFTANLTGEEGTTSSGTLDLKISYAIGKTGRYTSGPIASTAGGTVVIN